MAYSCILGGKYSYFDRNMETPLNGFDSDIKFGMEEAKIHIKGLIHQKDTKKARYGKI